MKCVIETMRVKKQKQYAEFLRKKAFAKKMQKKKILAIPELEKKDILFRKRPLSGSSH